MRFMLSACAIALVTQAAAAQYESGFAWRFVSDFNTGAIQGGSVGRGNPAFDSRGSNAWSYEWLPAGGAIGSPSPWYTQFTTLMTWDANVGSGNPARPAWSRADNLGPIIEAGRLNQIPGPTDPKPLLRFTNPQPGRIEVSVSDFISVRWEDGAGSPVDLVIALWDFSAQAALPLFSTTLDRPFEGNVVIVVPQIPALALDRNDSLIFTAQGRGTAQGAVIVELNPLVTLVAGGDCPVDANGDRLVNFADLTAILLNFNNNCP